VVRAIHVADGDNVTSGQVLIELDSTLSSADRTRYGETRTAALLDPEGEALSKCIVAIHSQSNHRIAAE